MPGELAVQRADVAEPRVVQGRQLLQLLDADGRGDLGDPQVESGGTHPQVFVALGSHAGYATAGTQRNFPLACAKVGGDLGRLIDVARRAGVRSYDRTGRGRTAGPSGLAAGTLGLIDLTTGARPTWARFAGVWSEGELLYLRGLGLTRAARFGEGPKTPSFDADVTRLILERWTAE